MAAEVERGDTRTYTEQNAGEGMQAFTLAPSLTVRVGMDPFFLQIEKTHRPSSPPLVLQTVLSRRGRLGYGVWVGADVTDAIYEGYSWRVGTVVKWWHATHVLSARLIDHGMSEEGSSTLPFPLPSLSLTLATSDPLRGEIDVSLFLPPDASEASVLAINMTARGGSSTLVANRLGMAWAIEEAMEGGVEEGLFGFGER
ncbi:Hypothetical protein NocV09_07600150 [Nannochloropsis oceanica]